LACHRTPRSGSTDVDYLLRGTAEGDEQAFACLVDMYWNNIYTQSLAYIRSAQLAEEATQDTFVKIWNSRASLSGLVSFENFLFIVARNVIISALRKKRALFRMQQTFKMSEEVPSADQELSYKEVCEDLRRGMELMPPKRKLVFHLSRLEGLSHEEISHRLGISKNTIKEHIVKGVSFLRNYMKESREHTLSFLFLAAVYGWLLPCC
jgi:RNA polymerase sigma-70 factor (family 1)